MRFLAVDAVRVTRRVGGALVGAVMWGVIAQSVITATRGTIDLDLSISLFSVDLIDSVYGSSPLRDRRFRHRKLRRCSVCR
mgnify:CR=1 FL=1